MKDTFCWGLSSSGAFTTKSATWLAHEHHYWDEPKWHFKWIWKVDTMPKIQIFLWQMCHNVLPVRGTLFRRLGRIDPQCPLCLDDIESIEHLFGGCPVTSIVWNLAIQHNWLPPCGSVAHPLNWSLFLDTVKRWDDRSIQRISFLLCSI